jgi:hypothetical protein
MMHWKGHGRKRSWPNLKLLSQHLPGGTEKNHKDFIQRSRFAGRDLNPRPLDPHVLLFVWTKMISILLITSKSSRFLKCVALK